MILNPGDIGALKRGDLASLEVDGCTLEWVPDEVGYEVARRGQWTMRRPGSVQHLRGIDSETLREIWGYWVEEAPHRKAA